MNNFQNLNGRVNASSYIPINYSIEKNHQKITENPNNITNRTIEKTLVSDLYFSSRNIDILQIGIKNKILNDSRGKYIIGRQSDDELKIIMRSIFFQHSKNMSTNINEQVKSLNTKVIEWSVPQIMTNIKQSEKYISDISTLPEPIEHSQLTSLKGTKSLQLKSFI